VRVGGTREKARLAVAGCWDLKVEIGRVDCEVCPSYEESAMVSSAHL
jgi:hypothetical protein